MSQTPPASEKTEFGTENVAELSSSQDASLSGEAFSSPDTPPETTSETPSATSLEASPATLGDPPLCAGHDTDSAALASANSARAGQTALTTEVAPIDSNAPSTLVDFSKQGTTESSSSDSPSSGSEDSAHGGAGISAVQVDSPPSVPSGPPPPKPRRSVWRLLFKLLALMILLALAGGGWLVWEARQFLDTPPSDVGKDIVIDIKSGSTLSQAAALLQEKGVISDSLRFQILARLKEQENKIQAGRFLVNTGWLPEKVLEQLVTGKAMLYRVTLREGLPWWEVARVLEREGICKAEDFKDVIHDPEFLRHWGIPFASAEGFLYPDTYFMLRPVNAKDMSAEWNEQVPKQAARTAANRLVDMFWRKTAPLWPDGRPAPATLRRVVTLASIVEKETAVSVERPRVAGVYANRLKMNMLLQADPTIIYGLGPDFSGPLLRRHLDDESNPYNTYKLAGLPPGPICSPGASAMKAALNPESHNFLYFVAKGDDGSHVFSENLNDHNRAVRSYRETLRRLGN